MQEGIGGDIWKRQTRHHRSEERDGPRESDGAKANGSDSLAHFWLEEDDSPGQHKLMEISPQMIYVTLLRPCISLQTFFYLGNVLRIKAIQSAYEFKRTWPFFEKQFLACKAKYSSPLPYLSTSTTPSKDRPKESAKTYLSCIKVLGVPMEISQLTDSSTSGLFSLHAFQADCFLMG